MKRVAEKLTFLLGVFLVCKGAFASELAYTCEVVNTYSLKDDGSLGASVWDKDYKGKEFSISRITGEIVGLVIPTVLANSTKVINKGNDEYSFKAIAVFDSVNKPFSSGNEDSESTTNIQLLEIQEFQDGEEKPFVAVSMSGAGIVTGICK